jgi:hypothetical protein
MDKSLKDWWEKIRIDKAVKLLLKVSTLKYRIKEHARLLIFNILLPLLALILPCLFIDFWLLPLLLVYLVFPKKTWNWLHCEQDLLLHGKEYISSQIVHSANSGPKLSLIVLLFNTFSPARLLDFQKKSTLFVYSILLDY